MMSEIIMIQMLGESHGKDMSKRISYSLLAILATVCFLSV